MSSQVWAGWGSWIRTNACWIQRPEPYRLAIPQYFINFSFINKSVILKSTQYVVCYEISTSK